MNPPDSATQMGPPVAQEPLRDKSGLPLGPWKRLKSDVLNQQAQFRIGVVHVSKVGLAHTARCHAAYSIRVGLPTLKRAFENWGGCGYRVCARPSDADDLSILANVQIFRGLSAEALGKVLRVSRRRPYRRNELSFERVMPPTKFAS